MLSDMFVEWILSVNVLALKVSGTSFQALSIFSPLKGHHKDCMVLIVLLPGIPQHFLDVIFTEKSCDHILDRNLPPL